MPMCQDVIALTQLCTDWKAHYLYFHCCVYAAAAFHSVVTHLLSCVLGGVRRRT